MKNTNRKESPSLFGKVCARRFIVEFNTILVMRITFVGENHILQHTFVPQSELIRVLIGDGLLIHTLFGFE